MTELDFYSWILVILLVVFGLPLLLKRMFP